ncbi:4-hydroxybenzoyl-CoA thioesterase [Desulfuromonas versatilis]|uniref:4-hydroxybenzoyl-CoA thioesterase n=1 Tax=Desulfuromonas versatilis TaxID=2802975 RepID=A0ABM8HNW8_9BACT|nr:acyl-CoA thioesterase [Desulfuromonas versatilis]BCR03191.1 4-hydroxybenzoyl-CoA thioesterase [Desulfuromonas versatilis]
MNKPYFPQRPGQPAPLRAEVERVVRFEEVDPLGIVWHGRYPGYFEDARVALGEKYGIGYLDFYERKVLAPIRKMHVDYHRPLRFGQPFTIEGLLHWSEAARLNYEFVLRNQAGEVTTTGYTVQMLMDEKHNVLLAPPDFYLEFLERWRDGRLR